MPRTALGVLALAVGFTTPAPAEPPSIGGQKTLVHGNYCGPGNNAPLPPIDALDAACARHDACTPGHGMPSPRCNARLRREADAIARDPRQPPDLRAMAGFVAAGAGMLNAADGLAPTQPVMPAGVRRVR
jgi:hypothetical protein